jgi:poly(hydroxyalkanoate) depolymerase family esterase
MTNPPNIDMKTALDLTRQGKLREAVDVIRARLTREPRHPAPQPRPNLVPEALQNALGHLPFLRPEPPTPGNSTFDNHHFTNAFGSRDYRLFVPSGYRGQPVPLIIMLHGCTQSATDFATGTGMNTLAEAQTFLVAYPKQSRRANFSKCWNWFNTQDQHRDSGEPAIIAGITRQIMDNFAVQPGRVFIAGLSAGGAAAVTMGAAYPELYAAVGVHSGLACGAAHDMGSAMAAMHHGAGQSLAPAKTLIPTILFHGDKDHTVNVANAAQVITQAKAGTQPTRTVTQGESGGVAYTRTLYGNDPPVIEEWLLHGTGHAWSGGNPAGSFADPKGPNASAEMVRFFFQQK